jgi:hypothetical protein
MSSTRFRPKGALVTATALAPFMLPVLASCSAMSIGFVHAAGQSIGAVETAALADRDEVPSDAYVEVEVDATFLAAEELPLSGDVVLLAPGGAVLAIEGAPNVLLHCADDACPPANGLAHHRFRGRVCDAGSTFLFGCRLPDGFPAYLRAEAARRGVEEDVLRVVMVREDPSDLTDDIAIGVGVSSLVALLWLAAALAGARGYAGKPRISESRSWQLPLSPAEARERLLESLGDGARVVKDEGGELVIAQGRGELGARFLGIRDPATVPRRVVVRVTDLGAYQSTQVEASIEEALDWMANLSFGLDTIVAQAVTRTAEQLERGLG